MEATILNVVVALSEEDRARLDRILAAVEAKNCSGCVESAVRIMADCVNSGECDVLDVLESAETITPAMEETPAEPEKPVQDVKPDIPDRRTVKSMAVKKIQEGHRDAVKALINEYGAEKIDQVSEDCLAEFYERLTQIGG